MVKSMLSAIFVCCISESVLAIDIMTESRSSTTKHEIFLGAGEALAFPSSIRYREDNIEGGLLVGSLLGGAKIFKNPYYPNLFTELGLGLLVAGSTTAGLYGSAGGSWQIFGPFRFRCELNMVGGLNSYVKGGALVGLSLVF